MGEYIKDFCFKNNYQYKEQATSKWIHENREVYIQSDKSKRRFDFAVFTGKKVVVIETNFYG